jgi:aspartate racemase
VRSQKKDILGVLGGMGPAASAEFLKTIYEYSIGKSEQDSPIVLVYSDPTFPDRTDAFLAGNYSEILGQLIEGLNRLREMGASKIVICCVTIHHLLPKLPPHLSELVISLPEVVFANIAATEKRHLLICSSGSYQLGVFRNHEQWKDVERYFVLPDEADQQIIHRDLIYRIKKKASDISLLFPLLESLLFKYKVDSFIVGCTEVHLLAKYFMSSIGRHKGYSCIDPLAIIAKQTAQEK